MAAHVSFRYKVPVPSYTVPYNGPKLSHHKRVAINNHVTARRVFAGLSSPASVCPLRGFSIPDSGFLGPWIPVRIPDSTFLVTQIPFFFWLFLQFCIEASTKLNQSATTGARPSHNQSATRRHVVVHLRGETQRVPLPIFGQRVQREGELRMRES